MDTIDPKIYDSPEFESDPSKFTVKAAASNPYTAPTNVPQANILQGQQSTANAFIQRTENQRPEATLGESLDAAIDEMSPMAAYRLATQPNFKTDENFKVGEHVAALPMQLDKDAREWLLESKSQDEFDYRRTAVTRVNKNNRLMGDHVVASFGLMMLDPSYLAIDAASLGAGRLAAAARVGEVGQRLTAGATAGAGAVGVLAVENQSRPVSTTEVVLGAMLNGAATAAFYRPAARALVPVDETFPGPALQEVVNTASSTNAAKTVDTVAAEAAETVVPPRAPATPTPEPVPTPTPAPRPAPAAAGSETLPQGLAGAKPRYAFGSKQFGLEFESDVDKAAYIASQKTKSKADQAYVDFVAKARGWTEAEVRAHGAEVRASIKAQARDAEPGSLRVPRTEAQPKAPTVETRYPKAEPAAPFIPGTETTASKVLTRLAGSTDPLLSTMASRLSKLLGKNDIQVGTIAGLQRSHYDLKSLRIGMHEGADDWTHMHEITHALTAERLRYGRAQPNTALGRISTQVDKLLDEVRAGAGAADAQSQYFLSNADEFMAGLHSGHTPFYDLLRSVKTTGGSALTDFVNAVRKILGMQPGEVNALTKALGLTDDLMQNPLRIKTTVFDGTNHNTYTRDLLNSPPSDPSKLASAIIDNADSTTVKIAKGISWSLHKTLGNFSPEMKRIATILVDDPLDMTGDSVVSQTRAIRAQLAPLQYAYEDKLKDVMAGQGFGLWQRIFQPKQALAAQGKIEKAVAMEMLAREQNQRLGRVHPANPDADIKHMADSLDKLSKATLAEMKASGVRGADDVSESSGYFSRRWDINKIEAVEQKLQAAGITEAAARARVQRTLAQGMRRANGWDDELAGDISKALLDRTRRKGYFEDAAFRGHVGNDNLAEVRDIMEGAGIRGDRLQRAMDVMAGVTDEAGKASVLKHRVDIDMKAGLVLPDGTAVTIADLIDTNLTNITERYLDTVSGRSGLARKGLEDSSAISAMRKQALASIKSEGERGKAAALLDDTFNAIQGRPVGEDMPAFMRATQAATRMVGLAASGLWQLTEYAPMMARYGAGATLKHVLAEMPGARQLFTSISKDAGASTQLKDILTRNSSADIRMRPFVQRLEDNFEIPHGANVQLALSQAQQLVPYMNAQKFVQAHQARVMANLMVDSLVKAAKGDRRAMHGFEQYGLKPDIMVGLSADIRAHGMDTAKWSAGTWDKVRGPLGKAADDAVLRNRTGEIPAFAQFSQVGKFIFTFRSFVLGAHNKVLAGTVARDGLAGISLAMMYQLPLSMLANLANATIQGKPIKDENDLLVKSLGQMGTFGLFSDIFGIVSGQKNQFGAPGLIAIDRLYKTGSLAAQGNVSGAVDSALSATPILSIIPGIRAMGSALKDAAKE